MRGIHQTDQRKKMKSLTKREKRRQTDNLGYTKQTNDKLYTENIDK